MGIFKEFCCEKEGFLVVVVGAREDDFLVGGSPQKLNLVFKSFNRVLTSVLDVAASCYYA